MRFIFYYYAIIYIMDMKCVKLTLDGKWTRAVKLRFIISSRFTGIPNLPRMDLIAEISDIKSKNFLNFRRFILYPDLLCNRIFPL